MSPSLGGQKSAMLQEEQSRVRESKVEGPEGECTWLIEQAKKASVGKADVQVFLSFWVFQQPETLT